MTRRALPVLLAFSLEFVVFTSPATSQEIPARNVLVLYSFANRDSFIELEPLKASVRAHFSMPVNFNVEYLESTRFNDDRYRRRVSETLHRAYSRPKVDLVIVGAYPALRFVLDYRKRLQEESEHLELEVRDQGVGFDAASTKNDGGLGLVSLAERIYQVNGTFEIDPNAGTRIRARVPVAAQSKAMAAAAN